MPLKQQVSIKCKDRIEANQKGPHEIFNVVARLELNASKCLMHGIEHANDCGLQIVELLF